MTVRFVPIGDSDDDGAPGQLIDAPPSPRADRKLSSHLRIAKRFASEYRDQFIFVKGIGWHYWKGTHFELSERGEVEQALHSLIEDQWMEAMSDAALQRDFKAAQTASGGRGVLEIASTLEIFAFTVKDVDADPYLLNLANGTYDLRTGQLQPHSPENRLTKVARGAYDPGASALAWQKFLNRSMPDPELRAYLQRYVGVALLGKVIEHTLLVLLGQGRNGKGVFYGAISHALGDYAKTPDPEIFMKNAGTHPTGQMDLFGARWAVVSETSGGRQLAADTVKRLTGGDKIAARKMRQDFVEFDPSHTAVLVTNHLPKVSGGDMALWERLKIVPFDAVIPEHERDPHLGEQLQLEADGILAWAIQGWSDYQRGGGLRTPEKVRFVTEEYRTDADEIANFIADSCWADPSGYVVKKRLHEAWEVWRSIQTSGVQAIGRLDFYKSVERAGYTVIKVAGNQQAFAGIVLK
ncbi:putative DNA primase/helicase [Leucobacter komagatae]|uniref:Putative DNA primase/helicase n=1 Tax=Leucobacter komagatae TaxID=55969 RepID=A0A542Y4I0_9MICO|nr:DNA primase family protein [Leucobacter komagatae]TQL42977.1 putative DNA primase/helicase [Leucobacter komagatae]